MTFDWPTIIATPMPAPAENEQWRERRRAERAAKQAQRADEAAEQSERAGAAAASPGTIGPDELVENGDHSLDSELSPEHEADAAVLDVPQEPPPPVDFPTEFAADSSEMASQGPGDRPPDPAARRRRRRGGRRRRGRQPMDAQGTPSSEGGNPGAPTVAEQGSSETFSDSDAKESIESADE